MPLFCIVQRNDNVNRAVAITIKNDNIGSILFCPILSKSDFLINLGRRGNNYTALESSHSCSDRDADADTLAFWTRYHKPPERRFLQSPGYPELHQLKLCCSALKLRASGLGFTHSHSCEIFGSYDPDKKCGKNSFLIFQIFLDFL